MYQLLNIDNFYLEENESSRKKWKCQLNVSAYQNKN